MADRGWRAVAGGGAANVRAAGSDRTRGEACRPRSGRSTDLRLRTFFLQRIPPAPSTRLSGTLPWRRALPTRDAAGSRGAAATREADRRRVCVPTARRSFAQHRGHHARAPRPRPAGGTPPHFRGPSRARSLSGGTVCSPRTLSADAGIVRAGHRSVPPGGIHSRSGAKGRLAHADHPRPRRRWHRRGVSAFLTTEYSPEGGWLQTSAWTLHHNRVGNNLAS